MNAILSLLAIMPLSWAAAQGTFQNLNFESPRSLPPPEDSAVIVPATNALPGWTCYVGNQIEPTVAYNGMSLGGPFISLVDRNMRDDMFQPINGSF